MNVIFIKSILIIGIVGISTYLGMIYSQRYVKRVKELEAIKTIFNILETKVQFTYKPLPDIFDEIAKDNPNNIGEIFKAASDNLKTLSVKESWTSAVKNSNNSLLKEDIDIILELRKSVRTNRCRADK